MQSRRVVRKDEITHIHSVSLAWTSYYLWPKFTTEKVPKDSLPFLGPPGDNSSQKPVSFFLVRSCKPFSFQKGQTNPCSCQSKYFRRQVWLLFWRREELYAWIAGMLFGTWMARSRTYIKRELFFTISPPSFFRNCKPEGCASLDSNYQVVAAMGSKQGTPGEGQFSEEAKLWICIQH